MTALAPVLRNKAQPQQRCIAAEGHTVCPAKLSGTSNQKEAQPVTQRSQSNGASNGTSGGSESENSLPFPTRRVMPVEECARNYWLMKAEPDSRIVRGKDVKFSVDDFELVGSTPWEGVRNYEARNLMKEMVLGDKILFYHSNCKNPGIAGFAEVSKEAYPDYTAWDSAHPYFDKKSDSDNPRWFMVDAKFVSRARHFVPLSLLRYLADLPSTAPPEAVGYVGEDGMNAIKAMSLITRGRLSVQRVSAKCWDVIQTMADRGGWEDMYFEKKMTKVRRAVDEARPTTNRHKTKPLAGQDDEEWAAIGDDVTKEPKERLLHQANMKRGRKRKASISSSVDNEGQPCHKSLRSKG